jgi:alpha-ribazole phosphatase
MKNHEELSGQEDYQAWITDKSGDVPCPGGESKNQFERRVLECYSAIVNEVRQSGCGSVAAVCHGGTIACIMDHLSWLPEPGRGYTISYVSGIACSYEKI